MLGVSFIIFFLLVSLHLLLQVGQDQLAGVLDVGIVLVEIYIE